LEDLVGEAQVVIDARRYEDPPGQGRLFVEPPRGTNAVNGEEQGVEVGRGRTKGGRPIRAAPAS
jgi:hypothetical protein